MLQFTDKFIIFYFYWFEKSGNCEWWIREDVVDDFPYVCVCVCVCVFIYLCIYLLPLWVDWVTLRLPWLSCCHTFGTDCHCVVCLVLVEAEETAEHGTYNTGLFISPSGISELDCATTKKDTAERNISIGRESLQVFFCTRGLGVLPGSTARG